MADGLNELLVAYSSSGSSSDIEDLAQIKSIDSMEVEYCSNHDLIVGNVDSAKKPIIWFRIAAPQLLFIFSLGADW